MTEQTPPYVKVTERKNEKVLMMSGTSDRTEVYKQRRTKRTHSMTFPNQAVLKRNEFQPCKQLYIA